MHFFLRDPDLGTMSFELISILAVFSLVSQSPNGRFMQSRAVDPWFGGNDQHRQWPSERSRKCRALVTPTGSVLEDPFA